MTSKKFQMFPTVKPSTDFRLHEAKDKQLLGINRVELKARIAKMFRYDFGSTWWSRITTKLNELVRMSAFSHANEAKERSSIVLTLLPRLPASEK